MSAVIFFLSRPANSPSSLDVKEDSRSIALNANDLKFHDTAVLVDGVAITETPTVAFDADKQTVTISFDHLLPAGSKAQLRQTFTGNLNDQMAGFYRAAYRNPDGTTGYLASTQFEATDARRAFPCFDEPALKARFTVTLVADRELTCLSNMDVANESEVHSTIANGPRKAVRFNTTPLMSTYLVAFIVGHLKYVETNAFRVPIRVYVSPDQDPEHGRFALDVAVKSLSLYERTFDNEYPLPKMDMVSVPDFAAGAMENWGLVTYRAVALLYNEKTSGAAAKNQIAGIVAHELAHQWFGNLVTMDFWEGLWLNEGFATWMSLYACDVFYPEWKIWEDYVNSEFQFALELDSLRSSHPIEVPVKRADEVDQIFDAISYSKGSAVLRMIAKYIGTKSFLDGVKLYIHKHAYGNTRTADLWQALTETSGQPIDKVMGVWTTKVGYPVVSVTENPEKSSITVKQNRFLRTGDLAPEDDENIYPVALGLRTAKGVEESMLSAREAELKLDDLDFFKLNADQSALYRTAYSPERLSKLGAAAKEGRLTVEDRTGMIADAGALALAGYGKTSGALSLLKSFGTETEYIVWAGLLSQLAEIRRNFIFEDEKIKDALKAFTRALAAPKAHELGWEFSPEDSYTTQQFKALMFGAAGTAGDEKVVAAAREVFERFAAGDHDAINPNIRRSVFSIVLRNGGEREYEIVLNFFRNAPTSAEKNSALSTLGFAPDPALQRRTLALTLSDEVRAQDMRLPLVAIAAHAHGIELQWEWFKENYNQLLKRLPPENMTFSYLLDRILQPLTQRQQIEKVQAFFGEKSLKVCFVFIHIAVILLTHPRALTRHLNKTWTRCMPVLAIWSATTTTWFPG